MFVALLSVTSAAAPLLLAVKLVVLFTFKVEACVCVMSPPVLLTLSELAVTLPSTKGPAL